MSQLTLCRQIAIDAHKGQFRRDGITPYISHPESVAKRLDTVQGKCVAWLHDVIEDTKVTAEDLLSQGVEVDIVDAVVLLTKIGEPNTIYYFKIKGDKLATKVKLADMQCNICDSPTDNQLIKYAKGFLILLGGK